MTDDSAAAKPQRSALMVFTQSTLFLQGLTAVFATVALAGLQRAGEVTAPAQSIWAGGLATAACMVLATGFMDRRWGVWLGSLLQAPMIAAWWISWAVTFMGVVFAAVWFTGVALGTKIDRERAERAAAGAAAGDPGVGADPGADEAPGADKGPAAGEDPGADGSR